MTLFITLVLFVYFFIGLLFGLFVAGVTHTTPWRKKGLFLLFFVGWAPFCAVAMSRK